MSDKLDINFMCHGKLPVPNAGIETEVFANGPHAIILGRFEEIDSSLL